MIFIFRYHNKNYFNVNENTQIYSRDFKLNEITTFVFHLT